MSSDPNMPQEPNVNPPEGAAAQSKIPRMDVVWQRKPAYAEDYRFKSPMLAAFLSLVPGLGQVYVGYYRQGFLNTVVVGTLISILAPGPRFHWPLTPLLVFFLVFYWLYNIVDASRRASYYNQALSGVPVGDMPAEFRLPETHGSFAAGVLLVAAGLVLVSRTAFGLSLDWLRQWWPLAPILFGAYLIVQSLRDRARGRQSVP
jgi:hypothetical protein